MKERQRHRAAFERYAAQGNARSLVDLAHELGASESAVKSWSRNFRWAERLEERERAIATAVAKGSTEDAIEGRLHEKKLVRLAIYQLAKQLAEGQVRATMADVDRLVRLARFLEGGGERMDGIDADLRGKSSEELNVILEEEVARMQSLVAATRAEEPGG